MESVVLKMLISESLWNKIQVMPQQTEKTKTLSETLWWKKKGRSKVLITMGVKKIVSLSFLFVSSKAYVYTGNISKELIHIYLSSALHAAGAGNSIKLQM